MINEASRIGASLTLLQADLDIAQAALGAAQFEQTNYSGGDPHTLAVLDLRVVQARWTREAAAAALAAAEAELAAAQAR